MRRTPIVLIVFTLVTASLFSRGEREGDVATERQEPIQESTAGRRNTAGELADGIYFAMEDHFSDRTGWRYNVTFDVQDGEIVSAEWNGANRENGTAKVTRSESGEYGMVENSPATVPWYEQIRAVEEWLMQNQDPAGLPIDDTGVTDAVSGVSVTVDSHFALAEEALAGADR